MEFLKLEDLGSSRAVWQSSTAIDKAQDEAIEDWGIWDLVATLVVIDCGGEHQQKSHHSK